MNSKEPIEEDTRKLTYVVIFMSMIVVLLYGLGPLL